MSKNSSESVELQRIISNSGSATMSASNSFTHSDISPMGPLYSTVPDAQTAHSDYKRMSRNSKSNSPTYQPPGEGEAPNEYDVIPENKQLHQQPIQESNRVVRDTSPVIVADNVLYGDQNAAELMKHKALTMEKKDQYENKYSGHTSQDLLRIDSKNDYNDRTGCCMCQTLCAYVLIMAVFVVALAGLVLSLMVVLRVYSVCNCDASGATPQEFADLQAALSRLQNEVQTLRQDLSELRSDTEDNRTAVSFELTQLSSDLGTIQDNVTTAANDLINERISEDGTIIGLNFSVQLSGVRLYDGCVTMIEDECTISPGRNADGTSLCITGEVPMEESDTYLLDALCVRTENSVEVNPLTTLLDIIPERNRIICICSVVVPNAATNPFEHQVTCGLRVTRCPKTLAIPANIVTTQTNFNN